MTPDELRARCKGFLSVNMDKSGRIGRHQEFHIRLESLCREMIAVGLERADEMVFGECSGCAVDDFTLNRIRKYIKAEAQRVKAT